MSDHSDKWDMKLYPVGYAVNGDGDAVSLNEKQQTLSNVLNQAAFVEMLDEARKIRKAGHEIVRPSWRNNCVKIVERIDKSNKHVVLWDGLSV